MEKRILEMAVSDPKSDYAAFTPKPLVMHIPISSIDIDLGTLAKEDRQEHAHFSIRGYVAGVRKKDRNLCLPFASQANGGDLESNVLPPLYVPSFRWWECLHCVSDIGKESSPEELLMEHSLVLLNKEKSNTDASSPTSNREKDRLLLSGCKQARNAEIVHIPTTFARDKHGSDDFGESRNGSHLDDIPMSNAWSTERHNSRTSATVFASSQSRRHIMDKEGCKLAFDTIEPNVHQAQEKHANIAGAIKSRDIEAVKENELRNDTGNTSDKDVNADKAHALGLLPVEVDEKGNESSGSDNEASGLPCRRKPKLRYLMEIMNEERNSVKDCPNFSALSSGMDTASAEPGTVSSPSDHADLLEPVGKGIRSTHRKRSITQEEKKRTSKNRYPTGSAKKFRASKVCSENKTVAISESQSEGGASTQLDLQIRSKSEKIKASKRTDLNISVKRNEILIDDGLSLPVHKPLRVSTDLSKFNVPTRAEQMEPSLRSSQSTQETVLNSNLSENKRSAAEAGHNLLAAKNSGSGECLVQEKVALDLSLNNIMTGERNDHDPSSIIQQKGIHGMGPQKKEFLWDLNEIITHKNGITEEKQFSALLDNDDLPLHKNLDISSSCNEKEAGEGKGQLEVSAPGSDQGSDKKIERASDDIPMDIVEMMAKNQHDRAHCNSEHYALLEETSNPIPGVPAIHSNGYPGMISYPFGSKRSISIDFTSDTIEAIQNRPISFPLLNTKHLDVGNPEESESRFFSSFRQNQPSKLQLSASGSIIMGSRVMEEAKTMWHPRTENIPMGTHSFSDQRHKGRTISDIKSCSNMESLALCDTSLLEQGIVEPRRKSIEPLDPYSNEAIPAMQLLSLMDQGMISSSFNVSTKEFVDKPFSPCNHHPGFNKEENQSLLNRSVFSMQHNSKDLVWLPSGVCNAGESSRKVASSLNCKISTKCLEQENSGRPRKSESVNGALCATQDTFSGKDKQRIRHGTSGPRIFLQQSYTHESPSGTFDLGAHSKLSSPRPVRSNSEMVLCTLNQNPAEFSIPDPLNEYTIGAKDLKIKKRNVYKQKPRSTKKNEQKRQKVTEDASVKKYARK